MVVEYYVFVVNIIETLQPIVAALPGCRGLRQNA